jgi:GntR family transcriptional regulator
MRKENDMLVIDKFSRKPIYEQIVEGIERDIVMGILREREQLPSIRELSAILGVNPNTIQKAFGELDRSGIIISGQGRGCFVADRAAEKIKEKLSVKIVEIENIAAELARAGIEKEKLMEAIERAYEASENTERKGTL